MVWLEMLAHTLGAVRSLHWGMRLCEHIFRPKLATVDVIANAPAIDKTYAKKDHQAADTLRQDHRSDFPSRSTAKLSS